MKIILLLSVIIFGTLGCLPQPEPEKLQQIVTEIETKNTNMTDLDWAKYEADIATLSAEYEKNKETKVTEKSPLKKKREESESSQSSSDSDSDSEMSKQSSSEDERTKKRREHQRLEL